VQHGDVHTGMTDDPTATLDHLFATMVLPPRPTAGSPSGPAGG
jgi:hypothetical protein